jgi:hypothetical protein
MDAMRSRPIVEVSPGELCCAPLGREARLTPREAAKITLRLQALADPTGVTIGSNLAELISKRREGGGCSTGLNLPAVRAVSAVLDICCDRPHRKGTHPRP